MPPRLLIRYGLASSLLYAVTDVGAALGWHGYDYTAQAISEYGAIGAPTRPYVMAPFLLYNLLIIAFGAGVRAVPGLRLTGSLLIGVGLIGLVATFFPMHLRGNPRDLSDTMHLVLTALTVACIVGAVGFAGLALGGDFGAWSGIAIATIIGFGLLAALEAPRLDAGLPTPGLGIFERINIGAWLLWVAVLSIRLSQPPRAPASGSAIKLNRS